MCVCLCVCLCVCVFVCVCVCLCVCACVQLLRAKAKLWKAYKGYKTGVSMASVAMAELVMKDIRQFETALDRELDVLSARISKVRRGCACVFAASLR
jgi:hypothetical protein